MITITTNFMHSYWIAFYEWLYITVAAMLVHIVCWQVAHRQLLETKLDRVLCTSESVLLPSECWCRLNQWLLRLYSMDQCYCQFYFDRHPHTLNHCQRNFSSFAVIAMCLRLSQIVVILSIQWHHHTRNSVEWHAALFVWVGLHPLLSQLLHWDPAQRFLLSISIAFSTFYIWPVLALLRFRSHTKCFWSVRISLEMFCCLQNRYIS